MTDRIPGVTGIRPGQARSDPSTGQGSFKTSSLTGGFSLADAKRRASHVAHSVAMAIGWNDAKTGVYRLLGGHCFTAGVVVGMGENLAMSVVAAADLVKTLTLAEYWESRHAHTFWERFRSNVGAVAMPGLGMGMALAGHFWPSFDQKAEGAYKQRAAMMDGIVYAFGHPKEILGSLTKAQEARYKEFMGYMGQQSLSGNYHAGVLFGELLLDLLLIIDLAAGLAKLVAKIPQLAEYATDLAKLAQEFRGAAKLERQAGELAEAGPRIPKSEGGPGARTGGGEGARPAQPQAPARPDPTEMTTGEKGVYGEAMSDARMSKDGFTKLNGDLVQVGDPPLGKGIDGVWQNTAPPPEYVITETKYGSSGLSMLKDGTRQMSDKWVFDRLPSAVDEDVDLAIRDAQARGQVEKWLLQVDSNGTVTKSIIPGN